MKQLTMLSDKEIKAELTKMLSNVNEYMNENGLTYTIFAGTLLGAVRHKGFIPWDDDVDIAMIRPEYERLLAKLKQKNLINGGLIAIGYEMGNGELPYIKIINKRIRTEEYISPYSSADGFLWIDVFPLDGVPDENIDDYYTKIKKMESDYLEKRIYKHQWVIDNTPKWRSLKKVKSTIKCHFVNFDVLTQKYIELGKKYDVSMDKKITNNLWGVGYKEAFPAKIMNEIVDYKFENIMVKGIKDANEWLTIRYGDYMKLPPENERVNHGIKAWK